MSAREQAGSATGTVRLTTAGAIVRYLTAQRTLIDGLEEPLFPGVFAIFGHGNVTCLGPALYEARGVLPTYRGQNEQGMALAGVAYAKAARRRQVMVATSSIGPGATNMVTAAAVAHANRLPLLLLAGDTFASRLPDPVLQQVEHFATPSTTVNDAFRPVVRYWDRIMRPEQLIASLPQVVATLLDPADCGPAFLGLPQDVQAEAYDYPTRFFDAALHSVPRPRAPRAQVERAAELLRSAARPLIIAGGGVRYALAEDELGRLATRHGIPVVETMAGKASLTADHPAYVGPIGVTGCDEANHLAAEADVVLAIGTRLQDFTTASWTVFQSPDLHVVAINVARYDAVKHLATPVQGDARETLTELLELLAGWTAPSTWSARGREEHAAYRGRVAGWTAAPERGAPEPTYAQVVGAINALATPDDYVVAAAGGFPGELNANWLAKAPGTFDCEYGFSCMGYELSGAWGARMQRTGGEVIAFCGDGSYLMLNSDLLSSVLYRQKVIAVVCDNGGYAVIERLQVGQGGASFMNMLRDCRAVDHVPVDFAGHAAALGCNVERCTSLDQLDAAFLRARSAERTTVIVIRTREQAWSGASAFWEVGVPEVSEREEIRAARARLDDGKRLQRRGV